MKTHVPTHGVLSEPFPPKSNTTHDRKGREGKGMGIRDASPHASSPSYLPIVAPDLTDSASMHELLLSGGWQ